MGSEAISPRIRPVVVGVDGSRSTTATIDLAVTEAIRHGVPLRIVHVWPGRYTGVFRGRTAVPTPADAKRLLEVTARRAELAAPDLPVTTELRTGGAANVLAQCSQEAELLVVGHRDNPFTRPSWGSTAAYLAHHSASPLMVNRGIAHDGPVVVASSARRSGSATLGYAFAEAALRGARLVAVHMWARPGGVDGAVPVIRAGGFAGERAEAGERLRAALEPWSGQFPDVEVEQLLVSDLDLPYTIERASVRSRLLVAGIGQTGRFSELLYGGVGPAPVGLRSPTSPALLVPAGWPIGQRVSTGASTSWT
ncbi:nucleotide-binding universal stress UspA family protein [Actinoplanes tereljensis]|uniref:Universal stress protein n=1 Tax=Paractinoplanes tereljensis TaxID=571912 RepID=A0A919NQN5_9ACTN|nr:universal stress protein [Actinoplanes tereljensis]GIF22558.1 universal stress protein [Actinoplanes tereljensis]